MLCNPIDLTRSECVCSLQVSYNNLKKLIYILGAHPSILGGNCNPFRWGHLLIIAGEERVNVHTGFLEESEV